MHSFYDCFAGSVHSRRWAAPVAVLALLISSCIDAPLAKPLPPEPAADEAGTRSQKVCQLTGDFDFQTGAETRSITGAKFNVPGTDLGSPFEHNGSLYFLFGDTTTASQDGLAFTTEHEPEPCPKIDFVTKPDNAREFQPIAAPGISLGQDEVPTTGFSAHGALYAFVRTNFAGDMGTAVLLRSNDNGSTFNSVSDEWRQGLGNKFVYLSAVRVSKADFPDLPTNAKEGLLVFGTGRYRQSNPYLAFIDLDELQHGRKVVSYFKGTRSLQISGVDSITPSWVNADQANEARDLFGKNVPGCVGELSVTWNAKLNQWLMLYNCANIIVGRVAEKPWGPWSEPATIFDPGADGGFGQFIHGCQCKERGAVCGPMLDLVSPAVVNIKKFRDNPNANGAVYAPYVIPRYTKGERRTVTIYYLMSTWNPYQVVLMKTTLWRPGGGEASPEIEARKKFPQGPDFHNPSVNGR